MSTRTRSLLLFLAMMIALPSSLSTSIPLSTISPSSTLDGRKKERRKKQTISIQSEDDSASILSTKSFKPPPTSGGSGKDKDCIRRIKREWKELVQMGIGYDWTNMRTINDQRNRIINNSTVRCTNSNETDYVRIGPFNKNILRWHFSISGPPNSVYENGVYHGLILLPKNYPLTPPRVQMLTPNGRFLTNVDICLSASSYHPETWTPQWTILSLINALRLHMLTLANEIGGMTSSDERKRLYAKESRFWRICYPGGNGDEAVVVDHVRMVATVFTPYSLAIPTTNDEKQNKSIEQEMPSTQEMPTILMGVVCGTEKVTHVAGKISPEENGGTSGEFATFKQMKSNTIYDRHMPMIRSKAAKAGAIAKAGSRELASKKTSTARQKLESTSNVVFLQLIIAVVILPLRLVSVVLKTLVGLITCFRMIINLFLQYVHLLIFSLK